MNRLYLLRHARARWGEPGSGDYDRPLDHSGHEDARRLGSVMAASSLIPETVLCSGARRARETWAAMASSLKTTDIRFLKNLYSGDASGYLDILREAGTSQSILILGHNPMMEDLATALPHDGDKEAMAAVAHGFPACGLAVLSFPMPLSQIRPGDGYLESFLTP